MSQKQYWQGFSQINNDPENFQKNVADEFKEDLPFEGFDSGSLADAKAPRRDFLKYLGFSTAAAALAAGCKVPERKVLPYANKPENLIPGEARYYATTYVQDGDVLPIVAKVRDGRPIKIEGNTSSSYTKGGTTARAQASVLDLYDMHRLTNPKHRNGEELKEVPTYEQLDKEVAAAMAGLNGAKVVVLSGSITSPSSQQVINEFLAKYPGSRQVVIDPVSYSGMLLANEASGFGRKLPSYHFDAAKVIVSLDADFLGNWMNPVENGVGYGKGRKIDEANPTMSKHYQFEGHLSTTGATADERFTHRPSETGMVALALLAAIDGSVAAPSIADAKLKKGIEKAAADLKANNGAALVVSGSNDANVQIIVNAINNAIGAYGTTINWGTTSNYRQGIDKNMAELLSEMETGSVGALLIVDANPVYTYFDGERFGKALAKVKLSVSFSGKMDETTRNCNYSVPTHHYLESWGDAEPKSGMISFQQPTISPLFKTRAWQTSLLKWSGNDTTYETYFRNYWEAKLGGTAGLDKALQEGVLETPAAISAGSYSGAAVASAASAIGAAPKVSGAELVLYQKVSIGAGAGAANPWLQELPDPISKACWGNYALISMAMAKELLDLDLINGSEKTKNNYEYYPQKPVIKISVGEKSIELPVLVIPGMNANTIAVAVGYGRNDEMGKTAAGVGASAFKFAKLNGDTVSYSAAVTVEDAKRKEKIAQMQIHNSYEGRLEVVRETTLATFKKNPNEILDARNHLKEAYGGKTGDFKKEGTLYGVHDNPGLKWGMNIDMNACFGCGACVVACHAENNVPVVGKREVLRYHDMHWLRIDRYFVSDKENPDDLKGVVFQPMMCQHCDNAPCENVCPVAATNHSSEGINQMAYNRCIGTRYCANNCPYKVRRFNWADYTGADSFGDNQDQKLVGKLDPAVFQMNDELTRMVLNPDVTVRSRGVMEKCSFCVQRTQAAKLNAKKEGRPLLDGEAKTACQQACAGDAIVFGNVNDPNTAVSKMRSDNQQRSFLVLEQLHVLPNVTYLAKVRNTDEIIESHGHHAAPKAEHAEAAAEGEHH
jgi:molybdopterin-containing oxidoreductase family iron-sulfur binding subunit